MPRTSNNAYSSYSPELYDVVRETLHRIADLDYQHDVELHKIDGAVSDEELKHYIKQKSRRPIKNSDSPTSTC